jgi:hypothetical protein
MKSDLQFIDSKTGVDGLSFEGEDAEDAFVDAAQGFIADEAFEGFDAESEFANGQRALAAQAAGTQAVEVLGEGVVRAVNDAEIFAAPAFDAGLDDSAAALFDEAERFDDHAFPAAPGVFRPPIDGLLLTRIVDEVDFVMLRCEEKARFRCAETSERFHVPVMVAVKIDVAFGSKQMKWSKLEIVESLYLPAVATIRSDKELGKGGAFLQTIAELYDF